MSAKLQRDAREPYETVRPRHNAGHVERSHLRSAGSLAVAPTSVRIKKHTSYDRVIAAARMKTASIEWSNVERIGNSIIRDEMIVAIGEGLIDCTLPHEEWTHEAHVAAAVYVLRARNDLDASAAVPRFIRRYNEASGVPNTDNSGFHATITEFYLRAFEYFLNTLSSEVGLSEAYCRTINSPLGSRTLPFVFYSKNRLLSREARRRWIEPDLRSLDFSVLQPGTLA